MSQLAEIEARLAALQIPAPWTTKPAVGGGSFVVTPDDDFHVIVPAVTPTTAEFIAHAPRDLEYLITLVRQQMKTRSENITETLLAYAELLESPTYTLDYSNAALMLKQIIHLLRRDSEDFEPRKWPNRG